MKLTIGEHAGFCFGVRRAVLKAFECAEKQLPCVTLGPLIHNPQEVERLKQAGIRSVDSLDEVASGETVISRTLTLTESLVTRDFLSGWEDKELRLIRFLHLAFALGPGTVKRRGHPEVAPLYQMKQSLDWEVDKFQGFVRFQEHDGMLGAVIHPKNYILPLLRGHFCARFPEENFLIYDAVHQAVLLYQNHKAQFMELAEPLTLPPPDEKEQQFQELWRQFYKTLEIKARRNEKGRMTHCPKRFWADMTEMKEELK